MSSATTPPADDAETGTDTDTESKGEFEEAVAAIIRVGSGLCRFGGGYSSPSMRRSGVVVISRRRLH